MSQRTYEKRIDPGIMDFGPLPHERGTWSRINGSLYISCLECAASICIDKHDIYANGVVAPMVKCHKCGFQDHVTLDKYDFPSLKT
jgi:predicted Zn finger-like uncharacterized protein